MSFGCHEVRIPPRSLHGCTRAYLTQQLGTLTIGARGLSARRGRSLCGGLLDCPKQILPY